MKKPTSRQTLAGLAAATLLTNVFLSPTRAVSLSRFLAYTPTAVVTSNVARIAFASDRDGNLEIYSMTADGADLIRLTENTAEDFSPGWSPDGSRLAFVSNRDGNTEIYVMNADGTSQIRLTDNTAEDLNPVWAPDGSRIAFSSRRDGNEEIYVMNPDGSGQVNLTNHVGDDSQPSFSPDSVMIAFASNREVNQYEIYRMNADGQLVVRLTNNDANDSNPNWSSSGKITFQTDRDGDEEVYSMNAADGTGQINLSGNPAFDVDPFQNSDGSQISYASTRFGSDFEIVVANAPGTNPTRLTNNPGNDLQPAFQFQGGSPMPAGGTLQFSASEYSHGEGGVFAAITVTRLGNASGTASVDFATRNGTASDRSDYAPSLGTLRFNAGETSKTFIVSIIDDAFVEADETINLTLRNSSDAALGSPATATLTIVDNDGAILSTNPNPIDFAPFFIRQQYLDFLGREPEPAGLQFYLDILNGCREGGLECVRYTRGALSANFFRSPEFHGRGTYVIYLYMVSLGQRPATVAELSDPGKIERPTYTEFIEDLHALSDPNDNPAQAEARKTAFTEAWLQRPEIQQRYGNLSNAEFVQRLLSTAGVALSNQNQLVADLNNGRSRASVLRAIVESLEVNAKFNKQAFVTMEYFGYLRRDPEVCRTSPNPAGCGYIFHNSRFQSPGDPDLIQNMIVRGFIESPEYRKRFGPP